MVGFCWTQKRSSLEKEEEKKKKTQMEIYMTTMSTVK